MVSEGSARSAPFEVLLSEPLGSETHLLLRAGDVDLRARTAGFSPRAPGERVHVALDSSRLHFFDPSAEDRRLE
ncbi:TOBE domain-containing protein [Labilithrix luteola]|uniref:TOBE domain-containing protein n=1 Tax=Labilithrix luteola TaxID=1391654 RepID=UPI001F0ACAD3|nr:TOBE domain-containing protein [Labilithrix luteola]